MKVCGEPGCPVLTDGARCDAHRKQHQRTTRARYERQNYGPEWPAISAAQLRREPACRSCGQAAEVADHVTPLAYFENRQAAHDLSNLQSLCTPCHNRKTATEDSAFGRNAERGGRGGVTP